MTTNNRMELLAVIRGLQALGQGPARVVVCTDAAYVKNPVVYGWVRKWARGGWRTAEGGDVANRDLWEQLIEVMSKHRVEWRKIKGHTRRTAKNELNHVADELAVTARHQKLSLTQLL